MDGHWKSNKERVQEPEDKDTPKLFQESSRTNLRAETDPLHYLNFFYLSFFFYLFFYPFSYKTLFIHKSEFQWQSTTPTSTVNIVT